MRNHFFTPYAGNKRNEVINIYEDINFDGVENIVEPYCGSFALSYYIWTLNKDKDYKYILNDNDAELINMVRSVITGDYKVIEEEINDKRLTIKKILDDEGFDSAKKYYMDYIKGEGTANNLFKLKYYKLRAGMMPTGRDLKRFDKEFKFSDYPVYEFLTNANIEIHCTDANDIINKYNDSNSFIFLDPPYLASCNNFYKRDSDINLKSCYYELYKKGLKNYSAKIIICHELNWIFEILFEEYIDKSKQYDKRYENNLGSDFKGKPPTKHICIKNY
jgi:site-specific DNA-adenine methylase